MEDWARVTPVRPWKSPRSVISPTDPRDLCPGPQKRLVKWEAGPPQVNEKLAPLRAASPLIPVPLRPLLLLSSSATSRRPGRRLPCLQPSLVLEPLWKMRFRRRRSLKDLEDQEE